ncbi:hypothetical protein [Luteimonas aquatica]|uniref:hypothetical protein n=1 Tax=Luteimonas aquatica TaxID=450364 RepID=UPI001F560D06|nr:hypothetical protein [Luteimonas aquatica]
MRQVFASPRLENVEAVSRLLEDAGIETRVTNGRSYKSAIRGNFSYRDDGKQQLPAVWIVKSEDQPRARQMLREAGLMDSTRNAADSYLSVSFRNELPGGGKDAGQRRAFRIKLGLLLVIAVIIALTFMAWRSDRAPAPAAPRPVAMMSTAELPARGTAPVPEALALAVLRGDVPREGGGLVCIAVDGRDPTPALLAALPPTPATVVPVSRCPAQASGQTLPLVLAVGRYESTSASGAGIVYFVRRRGSGPVVPRWFEVRPQDGGWRVIQPL